MSTIKVLLPGFLIYTVLHYNQMLSLMFSTSYHANLNKRLFIEQTNHIVPTASRANKKLG